MWPYTNFSETAYWNLIEHLYEIAESFGATFVESHKETFLNINANSTIREELDMKVYKFNDLYFWIEPHYLPDCPHVVFSFGNSIDDIIDDAEPFPFNLSEEDLIKAVKSSLDINDLVELKIRKWTKVPQDNNYRLIINLDDECLTVRTSITGTHVVNDFNIGLADSTNELYDILQEVRHSSPPPYEPAAKEDFWYEAIFLNDNGRRQNYIFDYKDPDNIFSKILHWIKSNYGDTSIIQEF